METTHVKSAFNGYIFRSETYETRNVVLEVGQEKVISLSGRAAVACAARAA